LSPISQHSDWSELTCHNSLHWTVTNRGYSLQFGRPLQYHHTVRTTMQWNTMQLSVIT